MHVARPKIRRVDYFFTCVRLPGPSVFYFSLWVCNRGNHSARAVDRPMSPPGGLQCITCRRRARRRRRVIEEVEDDAHGRSRSGGWMQARVQHFRRRSWLHSLAEVYKGDSYLLHEGAPFFSVASRLILLIGIKFAP